MMNYKCLVMISLIAGAVAYPRKKCYSYPFRFVSREEWGARPSGTMSPLNTPAPYVVIHHSYDPSACSTRDTCIERMRYMQDLHMITNGWMDIGYNFAVGSDGAVYEGRGWNTVGAHAVGVNTHSIGIVFIGDWISDLPPANQMEAAKKLIATGVNLGYISPEYELVGHRQVTDTQCPGDALFDEISTWKHFVPVLENL